MVSIQNETEEIYYVHPDLNVDFKVITKSDDSFGGKSHNWLYICMSVLFIVAGLFGNLLTIFVFAQKRFRRNSSNVYLLALAVNNFLYLIAHFFEDTLRAYEFYYNRKDLKLDSSIKQIGLNFTDNYWLGCLLTNYTRYVLRSSKLILLIQIKFNAFFK